MTATESGFANEQSRDGVANAFALMTMAATGVGVVLPGNLLPALLARWGMSDKHAGFLFLIFFITSTGGALLVRGSLSRAISLGCLLIALGMGTLAIGSEATATASIALYGLGLGIAMTSVSLRQSRRYPLERPTQMARLNLVWAVGACVGPFIALRGSATWGPTLLLFGVALIFGVFSLLALWLMPATIAASQPGLQWRLSHSSVPGILFVLVPLATGIESGTGGWLATYSSRTGHDLGVTISTVTCFWAGMLLSRLAQSYGSIASASKRLVLQLAPSLITLGLLLILAAPTGLTMLMGAFLLGAAAGPLYPLLVALFLDFGEAGNSVFVLGGVGAALCPWLTGLLSTWTHSLRAGLSVLLLASVSLALLGWRLSLKEQPVVGT